MEPAKPSSDLRNHAQSSKFKAEMEVLDILAEAQQDVDNGRVADIGGTFADIRKSLRDLIKE